MNNQTPSPALALFEKLERDPAQAVSTLKGMISQQTPETDWLEFKSGKTTSSPDAMKSKWSKALSAFANTDGGILIYGIDASRNSQGIDVATALSLIPQTEAFLSRLDQLLPTATSPSVLNVKLRAFVDTTSSANEGFVVAYIPSSKYRPHRAEYSSNHYYLRAGSHSSPMAPGTLRLMFYPQFRSIIVPKLKVFLRDKIGSGLHAHCSFNLSNKGTHTAKDLFIVAIASPSKDLDFNHVEWNEVQGYRGSALECSRSLHPGASISVGSFAYPVDIRNTADGIKVQRPIPEISLEVRIYSDNQEPIIARQTVTEADILSEAEKEFLI